MNRFCSACGNAMAPDTKFCPKCGAGITVPTLALEIPVANPDPVSPNSGGYEGRQAAVGNVLPAPPPLHWAVVLALSVVTVGLFAWIWAFVQAIFVKRLTGTWKPLAWLSVTSGLVIVGLARKPDASIPSAFGWLFLLGVFSVRRHVLKHYNSVEPINLKIGFWPTLVAEMFYLQYHFTRIARLKQEQPQLFAPYVRPTALPEQKDDPRFWLRFAGVAVAVGALVFLLIYFGGARNSAAQVAPKAIAENASTQTGPAMNSGSALRGDTPGEMMLTIPPDPTSTETSSASVSVNVTGRIEYLAPGRPNDSGRFLMHGDGNFAAFLPVTNDEGVSNILTTLSESTSVATASGDVYKDANGVQYFDAGKNVTITYPNTNIGAGNPK